MTSSAEEMRINPEEMRDAAQRFLADRVDRRAAWEGRHGPGDALDAGMRELGWSLMIAPEAQGGLGQRFDVLAPIYEELGKSLAPVWLSGTMATFDGLLAEGSEQANAAVTAIIEQGGRVAIAILPAGQSLSIAKLPMVAGAPGASHLLIIEPNSAATLLATDSPGIAIAEVHTWDQGRPYGEVTLTNVTAWTCKMDGADALATVRAHAELALAWDSIGGASQCLSETVDYMLGRQQFGRPIASFQALKHRAADHKVAIELARALVMHASDVFARRGAGWKTFATQARILAGEAFAAMAEDSVQLFGGVGFTWEYSAHLFLKRALANQIIDGLPDDHRDRIVADVCRMALAAKR